MSARLMCGAHNVAECSQFILSLWCEKECLCSKWMRFFRWNYFVSAPHILYIPQLNNARFFCHANHIKCHSLKELQKKAIWMKTQCIQNSCTITRTIKSMGQAKHRIWLTIWMWRVRDPIVRTFVFGCSGVGGVGDSSIYSTRLYEISWHRDAYHWMRSGTQFHFLSHHPTGLLIQVNWLLATTFKTMGRWRRACDRRSMLLLLHRDDQFSGRSFFFPHCVWFFCFCFSFSFLESPALHVHQTTFCVTYPYIIDILFCPILFAHLLHWCTLHSAHCTVLDLRVTNNPICLSRNSWFIKISRISWR